jgi:hypothetical protein
MVANRIDEISKAIIDIAMIAGLIGCAVSTSVFEKGKEALRNGANVEDVFNWGTPHCIISVILIFIIFFHIWQHWDCLKAIVSKKRYSKNVVLTITTVLFVLTVVSCLLYLVGFTFSNLHFHSLIVHLFVLLVIIHLIQNTKKLISLFRRKERKVQEA